MARATSASGHCSKSTGTSNSLNRKPRNPPASSPCRHSSSNSSPLPHHPRPPHVFVTPTGDHPRRSNFSANRRLLDVQRLSHDPADGASALSTITAPVITATGQRVAGMRFTDTRAQALLSALCIFRLLPHGFTNRELRHHLAPLLGQQPDTLTSGQISYDLRRLRYHGLINRIPHSHRYHVTDTGLRHALFLTRAHNRLLRDGLAELIDPPPNAPSKLRTATRAYQTALDDLLTRAGLTT